MNNYENITIEELSRIVGYFMIRYADAVDIDILDGAIIDVLGEEVSEIIFEQAKEYYA